MARVRTCADTLQILADLMASITPAPQPSSSCETLDVAEDNDNVTLGQTTEDMLPDLEDAMEELDMDAKKEEKVIKPPTADSDSFGAQIYYFPDEIGRAHV